MKYVVSHKPNAMPRIEPYIAGEWDEEDEGGGFDFDGARAWIIGLLQEEIHFWEGVTEADWLAARHDRDYPDRVAMYEVQQGRVRD